MTQRIFISATNTDIGKTYTTKLLLEEYARQGYRVGAIKPIETGVDERAFDANELFELTCKLNPEFNALNIQDIVPITYKLPAAPYIASNKTALDLHKLKAAIEKLENYCDILLIEGAGGLLVPVDEHYFMVDLAKEFDAKVLLVTHCSLGCINDTLLSLRLLESYKLDYEFVFNCKKGLESFEKISKRYFDDIYANIYILNKDITPLAKKLLV